MARKKANVVAGGGHSPVASSGSSTATIAAPAPKPVVTQVTPPVPQPAKQVSRDAIAKRAFEIWVAKGKPSGKDLENWNQAERELGVKV